MLRMQASADVKLPAQTDALRNADIGPATKCLTQRAYAVYGDVCYAPLAMLSAAHLHNLERGRIDLLIPLRYLRRTARSLPLSPAVLHFQSNGGGASP